MALFLIERNYAEALAEATPQEVAQVRSVNDELSVHWLVSFLSADRKRTYCLYEAANPELLREHARILGIPADAIVEVSKFSPDASLSPNASD